MQLLKRIWEDIRRGENIDLYITVMVAMGLVFLNLLGLAAQTWIGPLSLAVLALLAVAMLGNRYKVEEVLKNISQAPAGLFLETFPASFEENLEKSTELWLVGLSLSRTIKTHYALLERKLARGDSIRVLLVHPAGAAVELAEMREYGRVNVARTQANIRGVLGDLGVLKDTTPDKLEVRVVSYPLGFGGFALNPNTPSGILYLEHYPFKTPGGSLPKFILHAEDGRWYEHFKLEMQMLWESGEAWEYESQS